MPDFHRENPDVTVHLISDAASASEAGEAVELGIVFGDGDTGWAEKDRLFGESLYPVALPDICATIETAEDLFQHRLIEIAEHRSGWFSLFDALDVSFDNAQSCFVAERVLPNRVQELLRSFTRMHPLVSQRCVSNLRCKIFEH